MNTIGTTITLLCRGKRADNDEWVEGFYFEEAGCFIKEKASSVSTATYLIRPETFGLYTNAIDKYSKKIFTGDIVKAYLHNRLPMTFAVTARAGCLWFGNWNWCEFIDKFRSAEVIGNIHDTPELLKGAQP